MTVLGAAVTAAVGEEDIATIELRLKDLTREGESLSISWQLAMLNAQDMLLVFKWSSLVSQLDGLLMLRFTRSSFAKFKFRSSVDVVAQNDWLYSIKCDFAAWAKGTPW